MEYTTLNVPGTATQAIPLYLGYDLLREFLPHFLTQKGFSSIVIITNDRLAPLYGEEIHKRVANSHLLVVPDGERYKTLETATRLYGQLLEIGADRHTALVALGGGVIGDLVGFVAATFLRGLPLIQVPTSLLAMADASLGSKVGVDLPQGKNLVGAFKDALAIVSDLSTLKTLPPIEFRNGLAEILKAGLIGDVTLFEHLEQGLIYPVEEILLPAIGVKAAILARDPFERGERAYLNLGHTFGHAIEAVTDYRIPHGQAVAIGLRAAALLSERLGIASAETRQRVERALLRLGLRSAVPGARVEELLRAMSYDKKRQRRQLRFILIQEIGKPLIASDVPISSVLEVLEVICDEHSDLERTEFESAGDAGTAHLRADDAGGN